VLTWIRKNSPLKTWDGAENECQIKMTPFLKRKELKKDIP
jgi:hypothetical protein